jgi:hypothetical protein
MGEPHFRAFRSDSEPNVLAMTSELHPYFEERGFSASTVGALGWRVDQLTAQAARRYGLPPEAAGTDVWVIPYRGAGGGVHFERIRLIRTADVERFKGGKYRQPAAQGLALYDPHLVLEQADPLDWVVLVEGEANAAAIKHALPDWPVVGLPGQTSLKPALADRLADVPLVCLWIDRHDPGSDRNARQMADRLREVGVGEIRQVGDTGGFDANDALRLLGSESASETYRALIDAAQDVPSNLISDHSVYPEPPAPEAYQGLAGRIVRRIEPQTEADPAAILIQLLVAVSNAFGASPGFRVEADRHQLNLYTVVVGETSKARKGTSLGYATALVSAADPSWQECVTMGLTSGEGLVNEVRDHDFAVPPEQAVAEGESPAAWTDKRRLITESEFAAVLARMDQRGNTLSELIRQAWDGGRLRTLSRQSPLRATGAHISIIGHITELELRQVLTERNQVNGFGNRFLWAYARRSKKLPHGGRFDPEQLHAEIEELRAAIDLAAAAGDIPMSAAAERRWEEVYADLSDSLPGTLGAITSRAEAQVRRLATIYALLEQRLAVEPEHLEGALAVWDYCQRSAAYLFGSGFGDRTADRILYALRDHADGLTRTEIRDLFDGHRSSAAIGGALHLLERHGLARTESRPTRGRSQERWYAS